MMRVRSVEWHAANGDVIRFSEDKPFMLARFFTGTPSGAAEVVRGIRTDGQTTYHVTAEALTPSLSGSLHAGGKGYYETQRYFDKLTERLQAALDPKLFGVLIYHKFSGSFRLPCRPVAGASFGERIGGSADFDIDWVSDVPRWTAAKAEALSVGVVRPMWRFPWAIAPTVFGSITSEGVINNPTHIEIYPLIIIGNTVSGNIQFGNRTTGAVSTLEHSIARGDVLEIDMSVPSVTLISAGGEAADVTHWLTVDSVFPWSIMPGENVIYSAVDDPELSPIITLKWYLPEGGI